MLLTFSVSGSASHSVQVDPFAPMFPLPLRCSVITVTDQKTVPEVSLHFTLALTAADKNLCAALGSRQDSLDSESWSLWI